MFEDPTSKILRLALLSSELLKHVPKSMDLYEVSYCAYQLLNQIDDMSVYKYEPKRLKILLN